MVRTRLRLDSCLKRKNKFNRFLWVVAQFSATTHRFNKFRNTLANAQDEEEYVKIK